MDIRTLQPIVIDRCAKGKIKTDSDKIELAQELNVKVREIDECIARYLAKGTPCDGCKHVLFRHYPSYGGKCDVCKRVFTVDIKDRYERGY